MHVEELGYSTDELAHLLSITEEEVRSIYLGPMVAPSPTAGEQGAPGHLRLVD